MKQKMIQILFILMVTTTVKAAVGEYRSFHDTKGREIKARILQFNPQSNEVKLQLANRKIRTTKLDIFSEADQTFIRDWQLAEVSFSPKNLWVTINKKSEKSDRYYAKVGDWKPNIAGMKAEHVTYEIKFENRNKTPLKGLEVEYFIFHETTEKKNVVVYEYSQVPSKNYDENYDEYANSNGVSDNLRRTIETKKLPKKVIPHETTGTFSVPDLSWKDTHPGRTESILLKRGTEAKVLDVKNPKNVLERTHEVRTVEEKVYGVVFRVSLPLSSGGYAHKEFSYPKGLAEKKKVDWEALKKKVPAKKTSDDQEKAPTV